MSFTALKDAPVDMASFIRDLKDALDQINYATSIMGDDMGDVQQKQAQNALSILIDRAGGEVTVFESELDGIKDQKVLIEKVPGGLRFTLLPEYIKIGHEDYDEAIERDDPRSAKAWADYADELRSTGSKVVSTGTGLKYQSGTTGTYSSKFTIKSDD